MTKAQKLLKLFLSTLYISAFTFGGGFVIVTFMKKKFGSAEDFKQGLFEHLVKPVMVNQSGRTNDNLKVPNEVLMQKKVQEQRISGLF